MSHDLETIDGVVQMAWAGETPWHGLGTQVPHDLTPREIQQVAGVDWTVHKVPLSGKLPAGDPRAGQYSVNTNHVALVRDLDFKVLDVVPASWNPVQNDEAFDFFKEFVDAGQMQMETAGSINDGKIVWALAKIGEGFSVFGGDDIEGYLLFTNPWKFGRSVDIRFTPTRVVCQNTLSMALSEVSANAVRHSHRTEFNAERVKSVMGISHSMLNNYKETAEFLGSKQYTEETMKEYFSAVFPVLTTKRESRKDLSKQAERAIELVEVQPGAEFAKGSFWQLFNAVTFITNHEYGKTTDSRLASLWYGANMSRNRKAIDTAVKMAGAQ